MKPLLSAGCAGLCLLPVLLGCVAKKQEAQMAACIVGRDTLSAASARALIPDTSLSSETRLSRAALQTMLAGRQNASRDGDRDNGLFSDLSSELTQKTGMSWSAASAASLYLASKTIRDQCRRLPDARAVASYCDSLFAGTVKGQGRAAPHALGMNDSLLSALSQVTTRRDVELLLRAIFSISQTTASVIADFLYSEEPDVAAVSDASAYVKGLLAGTSPPPAAKAHALSLRQKPDDPMLALRYRSEKSIADSIRRHIHTIEALYKKHLKLHQTLAGTVWVTFVIRPDGGVSSVRLRSSDISQKEFLLPFRDYVQRINFLKIPERVGPMTFEFPFEFSPEN
jgi:hypothetical protein